MSSSSSKETARKLVQRSQPPGVQKNHRRNDQARELYFQPQPGPSHPKPDSQNLHSDVEDDEESYIRDEENTVDVDDAITILLSSLQLEYNRRRKATDLDDAELRKVHDKIESVISREADDVRRRRLKRAFHTSNCVREQIYYLRRIPPSPSPTYVHRLANALDTIVKESFDEEYRKVATVLGLVEALAEALILELHVFGVPTVNQNEHRCIRKYIANALTNLTFGQIHSKRKLCLYTEFMRTIIRIILEAPNLAQVYAGLVRNLSWMADDEMTSALRPTVRALAVAAVNAHAVNDDGCEKATLSALWNLAAHSQENKRAICDTPNCLAVLCRLLTPDSRMTAIVESATGILKYVSQYLLHTSTHLDIRNEMVLRLVQLLGSASFTIVTNTLGAISNLISKDPHLQNVVRHDATTINQLNALRNSSRDDIRNAVKHVLNAVNQPSGHTRFGEMASSLGEPMMMSSLGNGAPRLLPLRAARASPGRFGLGQFSPMTGTPQRSSTLPRNMAQSYDKYPNPNFAPLTNGNSERISHQQLFQQTLPENSRQEGSNETKRLTVSDNEQEDDVVSYEQDLEISETAGVTRNNSAHSLGSQDPGSLLQGSGFNSTMNTAANSSRMSPVSFSELPASPTMCTAFYGQPSRGGLESTGVLPNQTVFGSLQVKTQHGDASDVTRNSGGSATTVTRGGDSTRTTISTGNADPALPSVASDSTTAPLEDLITPKYNTNNEMLRDSLQTSEEMNLPIETVRKTSVTASNNTDLDSPDDVLPPLEDDYAILETNSDLLTKSIQEEMPQNTLSPGRFKQPRAVGGFLSSVAESPRSRYHTPASSVPPHRNTTESDRLLMECIMSEMPQASGFYGVTPSLPRPSPSKNGLADRQELSDRRPLTTLPATSLAPRSSQMTSTRSLSEEHQDVEALSHVMLHESVESQPDSEDSFGSGVFCTNENALSGGGLGRPAMELDMSIPLDCYDDDVEDDEERTQEAIVSTDMTIDCSILRQPPTHGSMSTKCQDSRLRSRAAHRALATSTPKNSSSSITSDVTFFPPKKTPLGPKAFSSRLPLPSSSPSRKILPDKKISPRTAKNPSTVIFPTAAQPKTRNFEATNMALPTSKATDAESNELEPKRSTESTVTTAKSAMVSPYNYQKPLIVSEADGSESKPTTTVQPNTKQMLVTTV
ncbi:unnamed protein product [Caenorhabditis auriculariae]|uniref:Uncharacterized protein n=1 Tax=Caenorhabditis auriculariae TaxID=2777116 RepID=A0A8S1GMN2_9PELO|nr:unnamed protein product [Caenorhabditis auriculariae]